MPWPWIAGAERRGELLAPGVASFFSRKMTKTDRSAAARWAAGGVRSKSGKLKKSDLQFWAKIRTIG
jgi:hypothetical protein